MLAQSTVFTRSSIRNSGGTNSPTNNAIRITNEFEFAFFAFSFFLVKENIHCQPSLPFSPAHSNRILGAAHHSIRSSGRRGGEAESEAAGFGFLCVFAALRAGRRVFDRYRAVQRVNG